MNTENIAVKRARGARNADHHYRTSYHTGGGNGNYALPKERGERRWSSQQKKNEKNPDSKHKLDMKNTTGKYKPDMALTPCGTATINPRGVDNRISMQIDQTIEMSIGRHGDAYLLSPS